ncbi:MAG: sulfurtransferase TusA family protein [Candidatus Helarchaeota archaeon]
MELDDILDVRKMTCPMPVLKTRKKIKEIGSGKILKIIGDFQPAKKNIQDFLQKEGHKILDIHDNNNEYIIFIKTK